MGTCVYQRDSVSVLPNGDRIVRGTATLSTSYAGGGDLLNLANDFKGTGNPTVLVTSSNGYAIEHNKGTANAGKLKVMVSAVNAAAPANTPLLYEVNASTDLSALNVGLIIMGAGW